MVGRNQPIFSPHTGFRLWGFFLDLAAFGPTILWGVGWISVFLGVAAGGFALTASPFWQTPECRPSPKEPKGLRPDVRPARWSSGFLRSGIDPGAAATVCFAAPPSAVFDFVERSLRSHPRINPSTQPADGLQDQKLYSS
ncbi:hypothetical protein CXF97_26430 [Pseudomonas sp. Choline-02u-1]|nr:hypothetical protein CXF97_26430 [Pseudomonas sp. Choline-02u-1]